MKSRDTAAQQVTETVEGDTPVKDSTVTGGRCHRCLVVHDWKAAIMDQILRHLIAIPLGLAFAWIGYQHFVAPKAFNAIVPQYLAVPWFWTYASGALEILLGIGLALPPTRSMAGKLLVVLVLLMSLANINMWMNNIPFGRTSLTNQQHLLRAAIQIVLLLILCWLAEWIPRPQGGPAATD